MFQELKAQLLDSFPAFSGNVTQRMIEFHGWMLLNFGITATMAIYLAAATCTVLFVWRMVKFSFDIVRCVALPSVGVALIGSWLLPLAFLSILPFAAAFFGVLMLLRG